MALFVIVGLPGLLGLLGLLGLPGLLGLLGLWALPLKPEARSPRECAVFGGLIPQLQSGFPWRLGCALRRNRNSAVTGISGVPVLRSSGVAPSLLKLQKTDIPEFRLRRNFRSFGVTEPCNLRNAQPSMEVSVFRFWWSKRRLQKQTRPSCNKGAA